MLKLGFEHQLLVKLLLEPAFQKTSLLQIFRWQDFSTSLCLYFVRGRVYLGSGYSASCFIACEIVLGAFVCVWGRSIGGKFLLSLLNFLEMNLRMVFVFYCPLHWVPACSVRYFISGIHAEKFLAEICFIYKIYIYISWAERWFGWLLDGALADDL